MNECRALELQCEKQKNAHLEEKIRVLESGVNGEVDYYTGNTGHKLYVQIAKGNRSRVYNKETMDRNRIQRPHPKYYLGEYYKTCWNCGAHGHYKESCPKAKAQAQKNHEYWNKQNQQTNKPARVPIKRNNYRNLAYNKYSRDINIADYVLFETVFPCKGPGKMTLAWVRKN